MKYLPTLVAAVVLAGICYLQQLSTNALERERALYLSARPDLTALRAEHERLSGERAAVAERTHEEQSSSHGTRRNVSVPHVEQLKPFRSSFTSGSWVPARAWKNCGQAD